jgi:hypothetical protein
LTHQTAHPDRVVVATTPWQRLTERKELPSDGARAAGWHIALFRIGVVLHASCIVTARGLQILPASSLANTGEDSRGTRFALNLTTFITLVAVMMRTSRG